MTTSFVSFSHSPDKHYYVYTLHLLPSCHWKQRNRKVYYRSPTKFAGRWGFSIVSVCHCIFLSPCDHHSWFHWSDMDMFKRVHHVVRTVGKQAVGIRDWNAFLCKHQTGIAVLSPLEVTFYQRQRKVLFPQASVILFLKGLYDVTSCVWSHGPSWGWVVRPGRVCGPFWGA